MSAFTRLAVAALALPMVAAMPAIVTTSVDVIPTSTIVPSGPVATSLGSTAGASEGNTTQTYVPIAPASGNKTGTAQPSQNVSILYGPNSTDVSGSIAMALKMASPAVLLEDIEDVVDVACPAGHVEVTFSDKSAYTTALEHWTSQGKFVMITNHGADCDLEEERGFWTVSGASGDAANMVVTVGATRVNMTDVTDTVEMNFNNVPGANAKRTTLSGSKPFHFGMSLPPNFPLYDDHKYLSVHADDAWFNCTLTFTGTLVFHIHNLQLEALNFDVGIDFQSGVGLSADVIGNIKQAFTYAPQAFSYTLVDVPGIVNVGPGVQFALGVAFELDAGAHLETDATFGIPDGKIHLDMMSLDKSWASGFNQPTYSAHAGLNERVSGSVTPSAEIRLQLALQLFDNKVDLSSGISFSPALENKFSLIGDQGIGMSGTGSDIGAAGELPTACGADLENGVELKSDFLLNIDGYVSKFWKGHMYTLTLPVVDQCWSIPKVNTTIA